jgi:hypothetical protein
VSSPLLPGVKQKVARLTLTMEYPDGHVVDIAGESLYAEVLLPALYGGDAEVQDLFPVMITYRPRKFVLEVALVNDVLRLSPVPVLTVQVRQQEPPSDH